MLPSPIGRRQGEWLEMRGEILDRPCQQYSVLYVVRNTTGGSVESLMLLLENLNRARFEPTILFLRRPDDHLRDRLCTANIRVVCIGPRDTPERRRLSHGSASSSPGPSAHRDGKIFGAYRALRTLWQVLRHDVPVAIRAYRATKSLDIDMIHVNMGIRHGKVGIMLACMRRVPCIVHERMWPVYTAVERQFLRCVDQVVHISNAIRDFPGGAYVGPEKSRVIYNAVDLGRFSPSSTRESSRAEFGWDRQHFVVGVIGRLDSWKGHDYFLSAMREVVDRHPHARGLIIGGREDSPHNREYADRLDRMHRELDLCDSVLFAGHRDDVSRLVSDLDAVVLCSSKPEPFGRVVIEAMASGRAVIATAAGGVPEIVDSGVTGILVPPRDSSALARAVGVLIEDPQLAEEIERNALIAVKNRFAAESHIASVEKLYETLAGSSKGGSP